MLAVSSNISTLQDQIETVLGASLMQENRVKRALRENRLALGTYVLFREEP